MRNVSLRDVLAAYGEDHRPLDGADPLDYQEIDRISVVENSLASLVIGGMRRGSEESDADA